MSAPKAVTPAQKAAILLAHLPEESAAEIFKALTRREIKQLSAAAGEIGDVPREQVEEALKSYAVEVYRGNPELRAVPDYVRKLAAKSLGAERARDLLQDSDAGGILDALADLDARTVATLLAKEHPQSIALVVAHLEARRAAEIVSLLPDKLQPDILRRLARFESVSPDVIKLVEEALVSEVQTMGKGASRKVGGVRLVADIMNQLEKTREQDLMQKLDDADPSLAEQVRNLMFVFDDIARLDDRAVQTLLKEVDRETLIVALKAADEDVKGKIFANLSSRAAEMIVEDLESRGPVRLSDVERAQADVVRTVLRLSSTGIIDISQGGADAYV